MHRPWTFARVLVFGGGVLLAACGPTVAPHTYVVEVHGSRDALERYAVQVEGLREAGTFFSRGRFFRQLQTEGGEELLSRPALAVRSLREGGVVGEVLLQPFVCRANAQEQERLARRGWHFTEKHQVFLTDAGELKVNTDMERGLLSYRCEASAPEGQDGQGWSTLSSTVGECSEPERAGTQVTLTRDGEVLPARLCHAAWMELRGGILDLDFSFMLPAGQLPLTVSLSRCLDPRAASYPLTFDVEPSALPPECPARPSASAVVGGAIVSARSARGWWRIERIDFTDGGHLVGEVDAFFEAPGGGGELRLSGHIDLPLLRVPARLETDP